MKYYIFQHFVKTNFGDKMKTNKPKEQFDIASTLFEMGMDYEIIEKITGITGTELFLNKINMIDFDKQKGDNLNVKRKKSSKRR